MWVVPPQESGRRGGRGRGRGRRGGRGSSPNALTPAAVVTPLRGRRGWVLPREFWDEKVQCSVGCLSWLSWLCSTSKGNSKDFCGFGDRTIDYRYSLGELQYDSRCGSGETCPHLFCTQIFTTIHWGNHDDNHRGNHYFHSGFLFACSCSSVSSTQITPVRVDQKDLK